MSHFKIEIKEKTDPASSAVPATDDSAYEETLILTNLRAYNRAQAGNSQEKALLLTSKDEGGNLIAGLSGKTYWSWLYVDMLWIHESQRKRKLGSALLFQAETLAKERGCIGAHLTTYSFQALGFYEKQGYVKFGELKDCPPGQTQYFMKKVF